MNDNYEFENIISDYIHRDKNTPFEEWFAETLQKKLPEEDGKQIAADIIEAVRNYDKSLEDLNNEIEKGYSIEDWFSECVRSGCNDMEPNDIGKLLESFEDDIDKTNIQYMPEYSDVISETNISNVEYNEYSLNDKIREIGGKITLMGMGVFAEVAKKKIEKGDEFKINEAMQEVLQEGIKTNKAEIKAAVAGAVKIAVEKKMKEDDEEVSIETIGNVAGIVVEMAEAAFDVACGNSEPMEFLERIGKAGIAAFGFWAKSGIKGYITKICPPILNEIAVDLLGGFLEHLTSEQFIEDVYVMTKNTLAATWEGIKKSKTVNLLNKAKNVLSKNLSF